MVMDGYYGQDPKQAIWDNINILHLSYLEMEESPQKLDHKIKLEDSIKDYLYQAPHSQKFFFQETAEVLHRSASSKKDFSGYKASTGWNAIQLYAGNLLAQPWRKEYREIKMYSGFYKHHIEANLVGAEIMFEVMGYKHAGNGILVLEGPVCPDLVANISRDALMAYVECQILKAIWEEVSTNFVNVSWLDVLEFRETHACTPQQAINNLNYRFHQKHYQELSRGYSRAVEYSNTRHHLANSLPPVPMNHSFPPPSARLSTQCMYNCCGGNYGYTPVNPHFVQVPMKAQYGTNGFCCSNGYAMQSYGRPVPTGQLIELEPQSPTYDVVDGGKNYMVHEMPKTRHNSVPDRDEGFENWDYVYRNLESQGYSKDLGERGDVLSAFDGDKNRIRDQQKLKPTNIDEVLNNLGLAEKNLKINENPDKYREIDRDKRKDSFNENKKHVNPSPTSSYENLSSHEAKKQQQKIATSKTNKTKNFVKEKVITPVNSALGSRLSQSKTLDTRKIKPNENVEKKQSKKQEETWDCKNCTYVNFNSKEICEMCSKSRTVVEQPMEIGGPQCPACTLVNPKEQKTCIACANSLKGSPTYI